MAQSSLFTGGPQILIDSDGSAVLHPGVWTPTETDRLMACLLREVPWEQQRVKVYGREVDQPRLVAWFGDIDASYTYSGLTLLPHPWTDLLKEIRRRCEHVAGTTFDSVLANLYRDGNDMVSWHADDEPELGPAPTIVSASFGTPRRFDLRHRVTGDTVKTELPAGSVLVMADGCQQHWVHQVPRTKKVLTPRINLTFRRFGGD